MKTPKTVYRFDITEPAKVVARELTHCPVELTDVLASADACYLVFGRQEPVFYPVEDALDKIKIMTVLGRRSPDEIIVSLDKRLTVVRDKHGRTGREYRRWCREWMAL